MICGILHFKRRLTFPRSITRNMVHTVRVHPEASIFAEAMVDKSPEISDVSAALRAASLLISSRSPNNGDTYTPALFIFHFDVAPIYYRLFPNRTPLAERGYTGHLQTSLRIREAASFFSRRCG
jgi:hypothetical protein